MASRRSRTLLFVRLYDTCAWECAQERWATGRATGKGNGQVGQLHHYYHHLILSSAARGEGDAESPPEARPQPGAPQPVPVGARACLTRLPYSARLLGPDVSTRARVVGGVGSV